MRTLVLAAAFSFILKVVDAKCKGNFVKKFDKCLVNGFKSTIEGCLATGEGEMKKKKKIKRCVKVEKKLKKCDYTCGGGSKIRSKTCTIINPISLPN